MSQYCNYVAQSTDKDIELHREYHDNSYGFPIASDNELFGRFILEINQAGLSWLTILKKQSAFRSAYSNFDVQSVAGYTQVDVERLLGDESIIRNRLKIEAVIYNARSIVEIQSEYGSFGGWLEQNSPLELSEWVKLFKRHFRFVGVEIVNEFLMSSGYLSGAHSEECPCIAKSQPKTPCGCNI